MSTVSQRTKRLVSGSNPGLDFNASLIGTLVIRVNGVSLLMISGTRKQSITSLYRISAVNLVGW